MEEEMHLQSRSVMRSIHKSIIPKCIYMYVHGTKVSGQVS